MAHEVIYNAHEFRDIGITKEQLQSLYKKCPISRGNALVINHTPTDCQIALHCFPWIWEARIPPFTTRKYEAQSAFTIESAFAKIFPRAIATSAAVNLLPARNVVVLSSTNAQGVSLKEEEEKVVVKVLHAYTVTDKTFDLSHQPKNILLVGGPRCGATSAARSILVQNAGLFDKYVIFAPWEQGQYDFDTTNDRIAVYKEYDAKIVSSLMDTFEGLWARGLHPTCCIVFDGSFHQQKFANDNVEFEQLLLRGHRCGISTITTAHGLTNIPSKSCSYHAFSTVALFSMVSPKAVDELHSVRDTGLTKEEFSSLHKQLPYYSQGKAVVMDYAQSSCEIGLHIFSHVWETKILSFLRAPKHGLTSAVVIELELAKIFAKIEAPIATASVSVPTTYVQPSCLAQTEADLCKCLSIPNSCHPVAPNRI